MLRAAGHQEIFKSTQRKRRNMAAVWRMNKKFALFWNHIFRRSEQPERLVINRL
jgi:hypothetical protein